MIGSHLQSQLAALAVGGRSAIDEQQLLLGPVGAQREAQQAAVGRGPLAFLRLNHDCAGPGDDDPGDDDACAPDPACSRRTGELAVGIRTFWIDRTAPGGPLLRFGTGAGITWGSDPGREWDETELKAARLLAVASGTHVTSEGTNP